MKLSRGFWETFILDLALAVMVTRFIKGRSETASFGVASVPSGSTGKWRKSIIVVDLARRLVGSQLFFLLVEKMMSPDSRLRSILASVWSSIWDGRQVVLTVSESECSLVPVQENKYLIIEQ